jgi:peroxiredoxin family protein
MTELLEQPKTQAAEPETIEKVAIVISKGSLEGIYPGLIMANGARMEGIEADLFFTFGLDAIRKDRYEKIKVATRRQPRHAPANLDRRAPGLSRRSPPRW